MQVLDACKTLNIGKKESEVDHTESLQETYSKVESSIASPTSLSRNGKSSSIVGKNFSPGLQNSRHSVSSLNSIKPSKSTDTVRSSPLFSSPTVNLKKGIYYNNSVRSMDAILDDEFSPESKSMISDTFSNKFSTVEAENKKVPTSMKDFDFIREIGKGSFGQVALVKLKRSGEFFALKCIKNESETNLPSTEALRFFVL